VTSGERQVTHGTDLTEGEASNCQGRWRPMHPLPTDGPKQAVELPGTVRASKTAVSSSAGKVVGDIIGGYPSELGPSRCLI
jgi:hypothetical protein